MSIDTALHRSEKAESLQPATPDIRLEINRLSNAARAMLKRAQKKVEHQIIEQKEALSAQKYQQIADSILASPGDVPAWANSCEIINAHTNEIETIKLNAKLSASVSGIPITGDVYIDYYLGYSSTDFPTNPSGMVALKLRPFAFNVAGTPQLYEPGYAPRYGGPMAC